LFVHDEELRKYIFGLDHQYSFVNKEGVQQLNTIKFQIRTQKTISWVRPTGSFREKLITGQPEKNFVKLFF
jgi:hypothetical protein